MNIQQIVADNILGVLLGALLGVGLPALIKFLRADARKKLTDKDSSNDLVGNIEETVADVLDQNKETIAKEVTKRMPKKK